MRVGSFSLQIPEGDESIIGYVHMKHGTQFRIQLHNHGNVRCDADIVIDGKPVGNFRVNSFGFVTIDRPSHDTGKFTFFKVESEEGQQVGASEVSKDNRGLIQVTFRPEKLTKPASYGMYGILRSMTVDNSGGLELCSAKPKSRSYGGMHSNSNVNMSAGITGLTGQSSQRFDTVENLDYDPNGEVTISLRLVENAYQVRKLTVANQANPVPAPVE